MFKIVQTYEKGKSRLSVVPENWEQNGTLHWPKVKADKLIVDGTSTPADNWFSLPCKLKRMGLQYEEAEEEVKIMLNYDDTDTETPTFNLKTTKNKPRVLQPKQAAATSNVFNEMAKNSLFMSNSFDLPTNVENKEPHIQISKISNTPQLNNGHTVPYATLGQTLGQTSAIITCVDTQPQTNLIADSNILSFPLEDGNAKKIIANQEIIIKNQESIKKQLATIHVLIETHLLNNSFSVKEIDKEPSSFSFNPISTVTELNQLENNLKNSEYENKIAEMLSIFCGKTGNEHGINVCYVLIDRLFTRKFLTECSWTGGSKSAGKEKIPFKIYRNVITLFHKVVRFADTRFSFEELEHFLKNILKNASKRNELKGTRKSRCKQRQKLNLKSANAIEHITAEATAHGQIETEAVKDAISTSEVSLDEDSEISN